MPDREKVIKGIEQCTIDYCSKEFETQCEDCPYYTAGITLEECRKELRDDFHALLKEQEAVAQKTGHWIWLQFCANEGVYCSECHTKMFDRYPMKKKLSQFCGHCGAKMDDEVEGR